MVEFNFNLQIINKCKVYVLTFFLHHQMFSHELHTAITLLTVQKLDSLSGSFRPATTFYDLLGFVLNS